jgi:hypothetical protein
VHHPGFCTAAALGPSVLGAISDAFGHPKYGLIPATLFATILFVLLPLNWIYNPNQKTSGEARFE